MAGTVAYSAPNNTDDRDDSAYDARLEQIGTAECRAAVKSLQREALIRREAMTERYGRWAEGERNTFRTIGSVDRAFELAVLRLPMMFWMHQPTGGCASIPTAAATDDVLYAWVAKVTRLPVYTDQTLEAFTPYFYQLGTQLGYAQFVTPYLDGLLRYPGIQEIRSYVPRDIPLRFLAAAMADIDRWVRHRGSSLMFVDGENDVAVAQPFRLGNGTHDSCVFNVPGANHHVSITGLRPDDAERHRRTAPLGRHVRGFGDRRTVGGRPPTPTWHEGEGDASSPPGRVGRWAMGRNLLGPARRVDAARAGAGEGGAYAEAVAAVRTD
ncbi:hypothetical protein [Streptomyces lunaelactis]|uniref:hypothetical protein n=1 Tax=Streptomyces lunaelactis TaxID=1535768 RepID=UPI00211D6F38|nr:hypothetical protein [Streptomyces lunaelactis]